MSFTDSGNIPFLLLFFDGKIQVFLERVSPGRVWDRVPIFRRRKLISVGGTPFVLDNFAETDIIKEV